MDDKHENLPSDVTTPVGIANAAVLQIMSVALQCWLLPKQKITNLTFILELAYTIHRNSDILKHLNGRERGAL